MFSTSLGDSFLRKQFAISNPNGPEIEIPQGPAYYAILFVALLVATAISVPLAGVLVRFRANHNPRAVQLDAEGGVALPTGPVVRGYFRMLGRVSKLEGVSGLYKGLVPTVLSTLVASIVFVIVVGTESLKNPAKYKRADYGILVNFLSSIPGLIVSLPVTILTYRSITTPYKLSYLNLAGSLRVLLTPTERRRPWVLYLTPGLLAASILTIFVVIVAFIPLMHLLFPRTSEGIIDLDNIAPWKFAVYLLIVFLAVAILTPLEVIVTRLAVQRNHASTESSTDSQAVEANAQQLELYSQAEEVIGLRDESDPYLGLADCTKRIINEEGWATLYRAWWIVLLGVFGSSFA